MCSFVHLHQAMVDGLTASVRLSNEFASVRPVLRRCLLRLPDYFVSVDSEGFEMG